MASTNGGRQLPVKVPANTPRTDATNQQAPSTAVDAYFAAIGRSGATEVQNLLALLRGAPLLQQTIDAMPVPVAVLNAHGEAILVNRFWGKFAGMDTDCALGKRHGELLGCLHVQEGTDGCGTSRHCGRCGAAVSFVTSQQQGQSIQTYHLDRETSAGIESNDFVVACTPIQVSGQNFTILALLDLDPQRVRELHQL